MARNPNPPRLKDLPALLESLPRLGVAEAEAFERDVEAGREALRQAELAHRDKLQQ